MTYPSLEQLIQSSLFLYKLNSVTRLGDFCKFPAINWITKEAQIFWAGLGYFENITLLLKTVVGTFWDY